MGTMIEPSHLAAYRQRRSAARSEVNRADKLDRAVSNARLFLGLFILLLASLIFGVSLVHWLWLLVPVLAFAGLVIFHERVFRQQASALRKFQFYERAFRRLDDSWAGTGIPGEQFAGDEHPYALDLDLFGPGSLYELLCTARTRGGQSTLAAYLLSPATKEKIQQRREAIEELRDKLNFRENLAVRGSDAVGEVTSMPLIDWSSAPVAANIRAARILGGLLSAAMTPVILWLVFASLSTFLIWYLQPALSAPEVGTPFRFFVLLGIANGIFGLWWRKRVAQIAAAVEHPAGELALVAELLAVIEGEEEFHSTLLKNVRGQLTGRNVRASAAIRRLARLVELLDSRDNLVVRRLGPPVLWTTQVALAIEAWRRDFGGEVADWLAAVGEIEALASLSAFAYERPSYPFPELADELVFEAEALGHPLLPDSVRVRNDIGLSGDLRLLLVSGSNMSGKSTFLRTVGINAVLALAGAPVCAARLRLSPLVIGASIRPRDSLLEGVSRFYAEVRRLQQIKASSGGPEPLLFLLDELLQGTNSHDRRIGAEAIVRGFVSGGGLGLVTTHDLALSRIADELAPQALNVHFEDRILDGRMHFDYKLQPGVVRRSNAIELLRTAGLLD